VSVTGYSQVRSGGVTTVTVTSDLTGTVYLHWYLDGAWVGVTASPARSFQLAQGEQVRIEVRDTNDPAFDAVANAPSGYPARRTLWWTRSTDSDVDHYLVKESQDGGAWSTLGIVQQGDAWTHQFLTGRLVDLATYSWRIVPVDAAGNEGDAIEVGPELVVRRPDSPAFSVTFNSPATTVTFAAA